MSKIPVSRLIAAAVMGALTTVAIAWACALLARLPPRGPGGRAGMAMAAGAVWWVDVERAPGVRRAWMWQGHPADQPPFDESLPTRKAEERAEWLSRHNTVRTGTGTGYGWADDRAGWPLPALASEMRARSRFLAGMSMDEIAWGIALPARTRPTLELQRLAALPLRPVWPGFAADTAVFAAAWLALLTAPPAVRAWNRRRAGRCVACGYDLRGGDGRACPECGGSPERPTRREGPSTVATRASPMPAST